MELIFSLKKSYNNKSIFLMLTFTIWRILPMSRDRKGIAPICEVLKSKYSWWHVDDVLWRSSDLLYNLNHCNHPSIYCFLDMKNGRSSLMRYSKFNILKQKMYLFGTLLTPFPTVPYTVYPLFAMGEVGSVGLQTWSPATTFIYASRGLGYKMGITKGS